MGLRELDQLSRPTSWGFEMKSCWGVGYGCDSYFLLLCNTSINPSIYYFSSDSVALEGPTLELESFSDYSI
jgi:hypothetical protein